MNNCLKDKFYLCCITLVLLPWNLPIMASDENSQRPEIASALFAGGCFWCVEQAFDEQDGVTDTISGYAGGSSANPSYEFVASGKSDYVEAVMVYYQPSVISYDKLLKVFWRNIDPFVTNRQFCDHGPQYRSVIYYQSSEQQHLAQTSLETLAQQTELPIYTEITAFTSFYPAEKYHQNYHQTNSIRYKFYKYSCGREKRLNDIWNKNGLLKQE